VYITSAKMIVKQSITNLNEADSQKWGGYYHPLQGLPHWGFFVRSGIMKVENFIKSTSGFCGITMNGFYTLNLDLFFRFYKYWRDNGMEEECHLLNAYHDLQMILWNDKDSNTIYDLNTFNNYMISLGRFGSTLKCCMYFPELVADIEKAILICKKFNHNYNKINSYNKKLSQKRSKFNRVITKELRKQIYERDDNKCKHCNTEKDLTIDHIIPLSKGGENSMDNYQTLCRSCNSKKHNKIL